jgi:hypothetical protein
MRAFEYRDLLVAVWWDPTPGFFTARGWEEFGRSTPPIQIQLPFNDREFVSYVDRLSEIDSNQLKYVGSKLFDSLFQGDILRLYLHLCEQAQPTESKIRIRLRIDPPIAARLPWECLYDTRNDGFVLNSDETTLVRFSEQAHEPPPTPVRTPLRVLLAAVKLKGSRRAGRVSNEAEAIRDALRPLETEGLVAVEEAGTLFGEDAIHRIGLERLVSRNVDVLHIVSECNWESDTATVILEGDNGEEDELTSQEFAAILSDTSPKLVVISGGERAGAASPHIAHDLLNATPALLTHSHVTTEDLVWRFTESFYRSLTQLKPVDAALSDARHEVVSQFPLESGWLTPSLFLSRKDARVFYNEARERVQNVYQLSEGRYRRKIRETLNRIWPKPERYTRQLTRWMPRKEPLTSILHSADFLGQPRIAPEMCEHFQRMLLIGEAGSGKTMTLYRLYYEASQPILSYSAKSPLPIYVSLSELPSRTNMVDFIAQGLDRDLFLKDLEEGRFVFLVDALDGLSARMAKRLSAALNEFMRRYPMNRFVVSARSPVPYGLDIPNWVELLPFTEWDAMDFLIGEKTLRPEPARLLYRQLSRYLGSRVGNPQVLTMARRLWRDGAQLPKTLSGLYMAFYKVAGSSLEPELREAVLPRLALVMSSEDRTAITRKHLEKHAESGHSNGQTDIEFEQLTAAQAEELLTELSKTRLLRGPSAFSFPHIGFQEFLTAVALRSRPISEIVNLITPAQWVSLSDGEGRPYNVARGPIHGALPFISGFLADGSDLIHKLISRDLLLATECFREAPTKDKVDDTLKRAIQHAITQKEPLLQKVGCVSLEARADRWAVGVLERLAADSSFSSRSQALEALGHLQSTRSLPLLQAAAKEDDPGISRAALDALRRIKAS